MKVAPDHVVSIIYTVTTDDGRVLDQALTDAPLTFIHGHSGLLPAVEAALVGKRRGDRIELRLGESAGPRPSKKQVLTLPRELLPEGFTPRVGAALEASGEGGTFAVWVREVREDVVVLDPNHPLSGLTLNVRAEVLEVREATADELERGRPQEPGRDPGRG